MTDGENWNLIKNIKAVRIGNWNWIDDNCTNNWIVIGTKKKWNRYRSQCRTEGKEVDSCKKDRNCTMDRYRESLWKGFNLNWRQHISNNWLIYLYSKK